MTNLCVAVNGVRSDRCIALTFDDGPNPCATPQLLDILDEYKARASFFVIGRQAKRYPEIVQEIQKRGHLLGNHTYSHKKPDFEKCDEILREILNTACEYVRPPYYDLSYCTKAKDFLYSKIIITGDVDSHDYEPITAAEVVHNVVSNVRSGSIVDLHDGSEIDADLSGRAKKTTLALREILATLQSRNYELVRVDELNLECHQMVV